VAIEQGIVVKMTPAGAVVKALRSEACESCSSKHSCHSQGDEMEVQVVNPLGAREGDRVVFEIKTGSFLKATFLLYVFPILCMIFGAVLGEKLGPSLHQNGDGLSVLLAFLFFFCSIWLVKAKGRQMGKNKAYHPTIIRILHRR
jgi:sigma-E factor negative regulatory protein RseC